MTENREDTLQRTHLGRLDVTHRPGQCLASESAYKAVDSRVRGLNNPVFPLTVNSCFTFDVLFIDNTN